MGGRGRQNVGAMVLGGATLLAGACAAQSAAPHTTAPPTPAMGYLRIAEPANGRLELDFDRLAGPDRARLASAQRDLRDAASTERLFDRDVLTLSLPPAVEVTARELVRANESRARLTLTFAADHSLQQLAHDETILTAANEPVEDAVRSVRRQLGLPPPSTS
jgi:hypothetical protein